MVRKEKSGAPANNLFGKAGAAAEKQMAHYLARAFGDREEIHVINDLRLVRAEDAAQIDHLVLHRCGFVIVESKSVSTRVHVNEHGEWSRKTRFGWRGMASPIEQARRQERFLHAYLCDAQPPILGKALFGTVQKQLGCYQGDVIAAISDHGIVDRAEGVDLPEIRKADQTPALISEMMKVRKKASSSARNLRQDRQKWAVELDPDEVEAIAKRLLAEHTPLSDEQACDGSSAAAESATPHQPPSTPVSEPSTRDEKTCRHCAGQNAKVCHGRYGYYLRCQSCDGNTPIKAACDDCGNRARIRKDGLIFYATCGSCGAEREFHRNAD